VKMAIGVTDEEKEIIRRVVPKASNKIQAAAMVRLYVAYPNRSRWTYTGLQGAVVLSNDLIGNTYWLKLVDVSVCFSTCLNAQPTDFTSLRCEE
jgi:outer membrane lipoprotein-sorting protein